jgi:NAD-dependent deacetylase
MMMKKTKIVFLTGAGISAESGIQTFRDADGLWMGHKVEDVASPQGWKKNKQLVLDFYNKRRKELNTVEPNLAHKTIAELEKDFDVVVVTQNVDDLHERGGSTNVIHLHGELMKMCSSKDKSLTLPYVDDIKIGDKHEDGSQLRPFIVWFGEDVPLLGDAAEQIMDADHFVIVGTSLEVYPAAGLMRCAPAKCKLYYIDPNPKLDNLYSEYFTIISKVATEGMIEFKNKVYGTQISDTQDN